MRVGYWSTSSLEPRYEDVSQGPRPESLPEAIEAGLGSWAELNASARAVAQSHLDPSRHLSFYRELHRQAACSG